MSKRTVEIANTVFERVNDGDYIVKKTRFGDLILEGKYSLDFVNQYARMNEDTVIDAYGKVSFTEGLPKMKSSQQTRDEIVERAKKDVSELSTTWRPGCKSLNFPPSAFDPASETVNFSIDTEKRKVVCYITYTSPYSLKTVTSFRGIAKCAPTDCFNVHIGKTIALRRALGLDVPSEYYNAPKPTEVRVGDIVDYNSQKCEAVDRVVDPYEPFIHFKSMGARISKIVDDSRE